MRNVQVESQDGKVNDVGICVGQGRGDKGRGVCGGTAKSGGPHGGIIYISEK